MNQGLVAGQLLKSLLITIEILLPNCHALFSASSEVFH